MQAPNELYIVEGGDHSLRLPKKLLEAKGGTEERLDQLILRVITNFVSSIVETT